MHYTGNCKWVINKFGDTPSGDNTILSLNPFTYRGYKFDRETGLYYLQSRYFNPQWCQFINTDTNLDTQTSIIGTNIFAYCDNNPVMDVGGDSVSISIEYFAGSNKSAASTFNNFWVERVPSFGSNLQELDDIEFIQNFMQNYNSMIETDLSEKYNVDQASSKYNPSKGYLFRCLDDSYYLTIEISACSCGKTTIKSADELDRICIEQLNKLKQK